jgi:hypothetical protein
MAKASPIASIRKVSVLRIVIIAISRDRCRLRKINAEFISETSELQWRMGVDVKLNYRLALCPFLLVQ